MVVILNLKKTFSSVAQNCSCNPKPKSYKILRALLSLRSSVTGPLYFTCNEVLIRAQAIQELGQQLAMTVRVILSQFNT